MEFSRLHAGAKYNLASSSVMPFPLLELPIRLDDLEFNGPSGYGYRPLQEHIARYNNVPPECVVATAGTSMANHLAMSVLFEHGDEVLIEHPTYEGLVSPAEYLGAEVRFFERRRENGFAVDPDEIRRRLTRRTRLIVLCNMHNPTGVLIPQQTLRAIGDIAATHGARVLVDEVYREALYDSRPPTAFRLGEHFVVTSSLTKAFGLGGLRCGWILAGPELAQRMWHIKDFYDSSAAHPAELLSVIVFEHLERIAARAKQILRTNRPELDKLLASAESVDFVPPAFGAILALRLRGGRTPDLYRLLREKYETSVAPGEYFDMPGYLRVGIGGNPEMTKEAFARLQAALSDLA